MTQPRIASLPNDSWAPDFLDAASVMRPPASALPPPPPPGTVRQRPKSNIMGIFAQHADLARGWFTFNNHIFNSTLSDRIREMATVRIAWLRGGEYEWAQHVKMAKQVGMSDAEVEAISIGGPDNPIWSPFDAAVLRAVDQINAERYIDDATWAELAETLDDRQMMDLVFTIGAYDLLCVATNNFGLEMDPGLAGFPEGVVRD